MFKKNRSLNASPQGARGYRAYVVGDVHGRLDLVDRLLATIHAELDAAPRHKAMLVFVGDLIDRGPDSAGVIDRLLTYKRAGVRLIVLLGNHEEVLLRILEGDSSLIESWLKFGGAECLESYGVDPVQVAAAEPHQALAMIARAIPTAHSRFLAECADTFRFGDYLIVHAGIRPGIEIDQQLQSDLRWIRDPFLADRSDHGFVVVHGHTISEEVEERPNRIGIDTGAYASGRLTALAIDGARRWFIDTAALPLSSQSAMP
ncbi:MAG: metallophosphoesterase family protein [Sphingomicrobium sp.]